MLSGIWSSSATALGEFFKWNSGKVERNEEAKEQDCLGEADSICDRLLELKPMLLSLNTNKATESTIKRLYKDVRQYKSHRRGC